MEAVTIKINFNNRDLNISAKLRNDGKELIFFLHGLGCTKESFDNVWDYDNLRSYSVITFDLIGFGDSSKPGWFSYTMDDQADVCMQLLDYFPDKKIHIAAHSMGGAIGLILAEKIENRLLSFINIEGNLFYTDCSVSRKAASLLNFNEFKESLVSQLKVFRSLAKEAGPRLWIQWIEKSDPEGFNKSSVSLVEWTESGRLLDKFKKLRCRKFYLCGEKNSRRKILSLIKDIKKISIGGSGHFPMNDNPHEFYKTLYELIRGN